MSDTPLRRAAQVVQNRKTSLVGKGGGYVDEDGVALMALGLDLDMADVGEYAIEVADFGIDRILEGVRSSAVLSGLWFDGLITGLILAEQRAREASDD